MSTLADCASVNDKISQTITKEEAKTTNPDSFLQMEKRNQDLLSFQVVFKILSDALMQMNTLVSHHVVTLTRICKEVRLCSSL